MSAVCILAPVVVAAWPAISAAVVAAANSLGYVLVEEGVRQYRKVTAQTEGREVQLEIANSEVLTEQLGRQQHLSFTRGNVTVKFARDVRGTASICVSGDGHTDEELRALGQELCQRIVQKYVYQRLLDEMRARQFVVVEDEVDETNAIHLKVRHWEE